MATERIKAILEAEDRQSPAFNKAAAAVTGLAAAAAAAAAVIGKELVVAIGKAVDAAAIQEEAEVLLASSLRTLGSTAKDTVEGLKEYAASLQDLTGIGDEAILANQRLLISIGRLEGEGLRRATVAALDLSAATGIAQRTAFDLVAKAATGYTSTLSRYGILIDNSLPKSQKFEEALRVINTQFGGAAQDRLSTYNGSLEALAGRFGDLQEAIGGPFRDIITAINNEVLDPFVKSIGDTIKESDLFRRTIINTALALVEFADIAEKSTRLVRTLGEAFIRLKAIQLGQSIEFVTRSLGLLNTNLSFFNILAAKESLPAIEALRKRLTDLLDPLKRAKDDAGNDPFGGFDDSITVATTKTISFSEALRNALSFGSTIEPVRSLGDELAINLGSVGVNAANKFGAALASAALTGKANFRTFFASLAQDLARAIAQALVLRAVLGIFGFLGGAGSAGSAASAGGGGLGSIVGGIVGFGASTIGGGGGGLASGPVPSAAAAANAPVFLTLNGSLPALVTEINAGAERGNLQVFSTRVLGARNSK